MKQYIEVGSRARLRTWLAFGYTLFIIYASLSPFSGWRAQGMNFLDMLEVPLRSTYTAFDASLNFLSYLPLGMLVGLVMRARLGPIASVAISTLTGMLLSSGMEFLQMYLPSRISSNMDLLSNSAGMFTGSLLALIITASPRLLEKMFHWRDGMFLQGKEMDFGLALLMLWVFGQVNPSLPLLGNVFISEMVRQPFAVLPSVPFDGWESIAVTLNFLMLGTLLLTILRASRNLIAAILFVLSLVVVVKFIAAALLLRSWALLLWINSEAVFGMMLGMTLILIVQWLPRGAALLTGAMLASCYLFITNFVFDDNSPSAAMSIYHWHYGHLLNYNGLAQTILLLFPVLLLFHIWRVRNV